MTEVIKRILTEADIAKTNLASKGVLVRLAITKW